MAHTEKDIIFKALEAVEPSEQVRRLDHDGVLEQILPEISRMKGMEQRKDYHHKDVLEHTLIVVDKTAEQTEDLLLRFVALLHDVGKPDTRTFTEGIGYQFIGHEIVGAGISKGICRRLRMSKFEASMVVRLVRDHLRLSQLCVADPKDRAIRRLLRHFEEDFSEPGFEDFLDKLIILTRADSSSHNPVKVELYVGLLENLLLHIERVKEEGLIEPTVSPLDGLEIMEILDIPPSIMVGKAKQLLIEAVESGDLGFDEKDKARDLIIKAFAT